MAGGWGWSLAFGAVMVATSCARRSPADDWPSFLGLDRDGKSSERGLRRDWADLPILWKRAAGEGYAAGSVARGVYYHFAREGSQAVLVALNVEDGSERWSYRYETSFEDRYGYDGGPRCSPVVAEDRVFILGPEGELHCVSADDGRRLWHRDLARDYQVPRPFFGFGSTPYVDGDRLIVMVGGALDLGEVDPRPNGTALVALAVASGQERYRVGDDFASYSSPRVVTLGGNRLGLAWCREGLLAFDPEAGDLKWAYPYRSRQYESVNAATPAVFGGQIFLSECYGPGSVLLSLEGGKPEVVWSDGGGRDAAMRLHWNTPIVHDGYLYGSSGRHAGEAELRCVRWSDGQVMWRVPGLGRASLSYADGHLIAVTEYGRLLLWAADPREPRLVSEWHPAAADELAYPCWSAPVVSDGRLYVRSGNAVVCVSWAEPAERTPR